MNRLLSISEHGPNLNEVAKGFGISGIKNMDWNSEEHLRFIRLQIISVYVNSFPIWKSVALVSIDGVLLFILLLIFTNSYQMTEIKPIPVQVAN